MSTVTAYLTYLAYVLCLETLILGGTGYAVFVLGHSGWWFLLAAVLSSGICTPAKWGKLTRKHTQKKQLCGFEVQDE